MGKEFKSIRHEVNSNQNTGLDKMTGCLWSRFYRYIEHLEYNSAVVSKNKEVCGPSAELPFNSSSEKQMWQS